MTIIVVCMQTSPTSFASRRKGCLHNAVPNRVPVSRCSGFEFRITYGVVVFVARQLLPEF